MSGSNIERIIDIAVGALMVWWAGGWLNHLASVSSATKAVCDVDLMFCVGAVWLGAVFGFVVILGLALMVEGLGLISKN